MRVCVAHATVHKSAACTICGNYSTDLWVHGCPRVCVVSVLCVASRGTTPVLLSSCKITERWQEERKEEKMLTCMHWLWEDCEIESWEEETEDQIRGGGKKNRAQCQKDVTESGEAQDGEEYLRMAAEVKGGMGGEIALHDASWRSSYDLYVTHLQALPLCLSPSLIHNFLRPVSHSFVNVHMLWRRQN